MTKKLEVLLDTNTLIFGIVFAGNERKLLEAIIDGKLEPVLSDSKPKLEKLEKPDDKSTHYYLR